MSVEDNPYRAVTQSELEIDNAPSNLNSIQELAEAIQNISLTPGPTGPTGPTGATGAAGTNGTNAIYEDDQAVISMQVFG